MEQILNNIYFMCLIAYVVALIYDYLVLKLTVKLTEEPIGEFDVVCMLVPGVNVLSGFWWTLGIIIVSIVKLIILIDDTEVIKVLTDKINEGI